MYLKIRQNGMGGESQNYYHGMCWMLLFKTRFNCSSVCFDGESNSYRQFNYPFFSLILKLLAIIGIYRSYCITAATMMYNKFVISPLAFYCSLWKCSYSSICFKGACFEIFGKLIFFQRIDRVTYCENILNLYLFCK